MLMSAAVYSGKNASVVSLAAVCVCVMLRFLRATTAQSRY